MLCGPCQIGPCRSRGFNTLRSVTRKQIKNNKNEKGETLLGLEGGGKEKRSYENPSEYMHEVAKEARPAAVAEEFAENYVLSRAG